LNNAIDLPFRFAKVTKIGLTLSNQSDELNYYEEIRIRLEKKKPQRSNCGHFYKKYGV